ncbi:MAG TPA: septal ring lytic transglycosylase RlpA family protein [Baekduia sp.]|nr:septal ring lytic transglycosylase RlpA family protein [Baekduia sp.]
MLRRNTVRARVLPGALLGLAVLAAAAPVAAGADTPTAASSAHKHHRKHVLAYAAHAKLSVAAVRRDVVAGQHVVVAGTLRPSARGRKVALQVLRHGRWAVVDHDRTTRRGKYQLLWKATQPGRRALRVRFSGHRGILAAHRRAGHAQIYRRAFASWYGPGFYGHAMACGGTLTAGTLGVAHKTLPCGTMVTLRYGNRSVRVPVVDRGPYVAGRDFDLTAATKARLGFGSTGVVLSTR